MYVSGYGNGVVQCPANKFALGCGINPLRKKTICLLLSCGNTGLSLFV